jgi:PAS domain-containing protein
LINQTPRNSAIALRALDQLATGLIVTDSGGRVVEMNRPAARIARLEGWADHPERQAWYGAHR